ncbi:hypothetical protein DES53_102835 [Roseimicrobium gellanilyticum]|uniref:Uncharacterized protein n=1 Tax=Roseimicrobium gellanilyticum TaxID=748857 RepID=A0A366HU54_9BACT|nr:hypothetical protein DES53_102835 [Roseimicrobium gellanilyticum]
MYSLGDYAAWDVERGRREDGFAMDGQAVFAPELAL